MGTHTRAWRLPGCTLIMAILTVAYAAGAQEPAPSKPAAESAAESAPRNVLADIQKAMSEADEATLQRIYDEDRDSVSHIWAVMALERVHFNLAAATKAAQVCQQTLADSAPAIALKCGQFESGNLRLAGHFKLASQLEDTLIQRYTGRGVDKMLAGMKQYQASHVDSAKPELAAPQQEVVLPYVRDGGHPSLRPKVKASANDKDVNLVLDTGASALTLDEHTAKRLGVRLLDNTHMSAGLLAHSIPSKEGILDSLTIGPLVLHELPVNVVQSDNIAIFGLRLMAPLGTLRFTQDALHISAADSTPPACDGNMRVGSDIFANNLRLLPELLIDREPRTVLLDTGLDMYLAGSKTAVDEVTLLKRGKLPTKDLGGRHAFANIRVAKVNVVISGQPIDIKFPVYADSNLAWPILLGSGALRDMDFLLDFRHGRQCFVLHPDLK